MISADRINLQLWNLETATIEYKSTDIFSSYVYYAIERYIRTSKAPRFFEQAFLKYPAEKFTEMIKTILEQDDLSDDGIIKTAARILKAYESAD